MNPLEGGGLGSDLLQHILQMVDSDFGYCVPEQCLRCVRAHCPARGANAIMECCDEGMYLVHSSALIIKKLKANKQRELASQASKMGGNGQSIKTANKVPTKDKVQIKLPPRIKIQKHTKLETNWRLEVHEEKREEHKTSRSRCRQKQWKDKHKREDKDYTHRH